MNTSITLANAVADLRGKYEKVRFWMHAVDEAAENGDLNNADLVCLQCELEEMAALIETQRAAFRQISGGDL